MQHHIPHLIETSVVWLATAATSVGTLILGAFVPPEQFAALQMLLLPLIGGMIASGGLLLANPQKEDRKAVLSRMIAGLFCGACGPSVLIYCFPSLAGAGTNPVLLLVGGAGIGGLACILFKPAAEKAFRRSSDIAEHVLDVAEKRFLPRKDEDEKPTTKL